jgi:3-phenylpropionate/trans-cinnamate dioxygenase ferredoxin reductase component
MSTATIAIVGAGLAGAKAAEALRIDGFAGRIVLFGDEPHRPYERPPLSKDYLQGRTDRDAAFVHPADWYAQHRVELRLADPVTALDPAAHRLSTRSGDRFGYDKLLLSTGASPVRLPVPGAELAGVHHLRTLDDSDALRTALRPDRRVVIIGGGWIGLETAAAARAAGASVTVLEQAELPLLRVLGPRLAAVFADLHVAHGVRLHTGAGVTGLGAAAGDPTTVGSVRLDDGQEIAADLVVVGIGVRPNVELARAAGLEVDNGIVVDAALRTSDPDICAAGDVANAYHPRLGRHLRVEHWANALHQPVVAAQTLLDRPAGYDRLPYFFTDQYELGMEFTGDPAPDDRLVVRGDLRGREFVAFWLRDGRLTAAMNVNVWDVGEPVRELIRSGQPIDETRLADPAIPLGQLVAAPPRSTT